MLELAAVSAPQAGGRTAERLFQSAQLRARATALAAGLAREQAPFRARTIRLQSQWVAQFPRQLPLPTIDAGGTAALEALFTVLFFTDHWPRLEAHARFISCG